VISDGLAFSTGLPNCREGRLHPLGSVTPSWLRQVAERADELGYYSLWLNEFPQTDPKIKSGPGQAPNYFDPLITIADVAARTQRVRYVTGTLVLPQHHPLILSRQTATLDVLTEGRITCGVGLGGSVEEYRRLRGELGIVNRGQMMDEFLAALRCLWESPLATFEGRYVSFRDVEIFPKPLQRPLPVFVAGHADGALRRVVHYGQGWIDSHLSPDVIRQTADRLNTIRRELGLPPLIVARQFYVSVAMTQAEAEDNVARSLPHEPPGGGGGQSGSDRRLVGTPEQLAERIAEYVRAGVCEVCAIFFAPNVARALAQMELFVDRVIPRLRSLRA
jgi:probable F420-dependent oxidoreductase